MAAAHPPSVLRHLCRLVGAEPTDRLPDAELLQRFACHREEAAFAALVRRHGPLVLGVCRRVLHNWHDAEDAFQAAFLVLAQKARSIARQASVGGWLYQVAYHIAIRARSRAASRQQHERPADRPPAPDPLDEVTGRELLGVLDEELNRLPQRHRTPLVLCYLEGRTRDQAARLLGWSLRALKHRLEQGRALLRARLARRGLALPAVLLAAGLAEGATRAALPGSLAGSTVRAAVRAASGGAAAASTPAGALAGEALGALGAAKVKTVAALLVAAGVFVFAAAGFPHPGAGQAEPGKPDAAPKASAKHPGAPTGPGQTTGPAAPANARIAGRVLDAAGKPVPGARVVVVGLPKGATQPRGVRLLGEKVLGGDRAGADGRFRVAIPRKSLEPYERLYALAGAAGHGLAWKQTPRDPARGEMTLRLAEEKVLRGRLLDFQGLPAAGVRVRVTALGKRGSGEMGDTWLSGLPKGNSPPWPAAAVTGKDGKFLLRGLNPDLHGHLAVEDDRYAPQSVEINARAGRKVQEVNLVLAPPQTIEGVVTAADTKKPLAHAVVGVNSDQNPDAPEAMGPGTSGQTDARGRFRLNPPPGKLFTLTARPGEGGPYLEAVKTIRWPRGAVRQEVNLTLPRGVLIRGKVTEKGSGKPVAGAIVRDTVRLWINPTVSTRADGTFEVVVRPGKGHLLIKGPGNDCIPREITFPELDGGKPSGRRMYPDAVVDFNLKPGAPAKEVAVELRRGVTIRGRLVGPDGKPPREAVMLCWNQVPQYAPTWFAAGVHVADGRFELRGCDPDRTYPVHFLDPVNKRGTTVRLSVKKAGGKPVTVRLQPCGSAEVRFVNKQGKPLPDFRPIFYIVVRTGPYYSADEASGDSDFVANVDRLNYSGGGSAVDGKGGAQYPVLIPGATYRILDYNLKSVKDFTVKPGEKLRLPDIVIAGP